MYRLPAFNRCGRRQVKPSQGGHALVGRLLHHPGAVPPCHEGRPRVRCCGHGITSFDFKSDSWLAYMTGRIACCPRLRCSRRRGASPGGHAVMFFGHCWLAWVVDGGCQYARTAQWPRMHRGDCLGKHGGMYAPVGVAGQARSSAEPGQGTRLVRRSCLRECFDGRSLGNHRGRWASRPC